MTKVVKVVSATRAYDVELLLRMGGASAVLFIEPAGDAGYYIRVACQNADVAKAVEKYALGGPPTPASPMANLNFPSFWLAGFKEQESAQSEIELLEHDLRSLLNRPAGES